MCRMILRESITWYINNGSTVYDTMLDATKAFDRVEYCKLFKLSTERDLPTVIIYVYWSFGKNILE